MATIRRKKQVQDETLIDLSQAKVSAERFWEKNQKILLIILGGLFLVVGGYFFYRFVIVEPKQKEAIEQMFQAQLQFERDSFDLALNNPGGGYAGFLEIIDKYGSTPAGNTAHYYAGICYLHLGGFEDAISHLETFSPKDDITEAMKLGAIGDAYSELNQLDKALAQYVKAAGAADNNLTTPYFLLKTGQLHEKQGNREEARSAYSRILSEYPDSEEGQEIEKYLARLESPSQG